MPVDRTRPTSRGTGTLDADGSEALRDGRSSPRDPRVERFFADRNGVRQGTALVNDPIDPSARGDGAVGHHLLRRQWMVKCGGPHR